MKILDLFAGIGGFSLAAHWMGWETAAFVEWDKDCQKVLEKNFPDVPVYGDITNFHYEQERERIGPIDLICGGFPCQPFSAAGKRNGQADDRYLWPEMLRTIREVGPRWVVGENVAGLVTMDGGRVFDEICTSLEDEGYQVEAFIIPACAVGAPHRRDRVWIVAHLAIWGERMRVEREQDAGQTHEPGKSAVNGTTSNGELVGRWSSQTGGLGVDGELLEDRIWKESAIRCSAHNRELVGYTTDPDGTGLAQRQGVGGNARQELPTVVGRLWKEDWLQVATRLCRMDDGLPAWVDRHRTRRLKQLGNSIVPQVVYEIFRAIQEVENAQ